MPDISKVLASIAACDDAQRLRTWIQNAEALGRTEVANAAFRKLIALVPGEEKGTVEHDFWQTVYAFEFMLKEERGKTIRLSRTRQKIGRVGILDTLKDWALAKKSTSGFDMLLERQMPELTGEAIILRHAEKFDSSVCAAARDRLSKAGVNVDHLLKM